MAKLFIFSRTISGQPLRAGDLKIETDPVEALRCNGFVSFFFRWQSMVKAWGLSSLAKREARSAKQRDEHEQSGVESVSATASFKALGSFFFSGRRNRHNHQQQTDDQVDREE
jgi:hypothetical protein